jgi:hypothetical protein
MKLKLLLFFMLFSVGFLKAQDTIRSLVISEIRMDFGNCAYIELTNMGADAVDLSKFELGYCGPWNGKYETDDNSRMMLPNVQLAPGKSYVIAKVNDYTHKKWLIDPKYFNDEWGFNPGILKVADFTVNISESNPQLPQSVDSVSPHNGIFGDYNGWGYHYLRYHYTLANGQKDSVVVDQVGGTFDESPSGQNTKGPHAVAGISDATASRILIRKFGIKKGNLDFPTNRGTSLDESDWIPFPILGGANGYNRGILWSVGNHGDFHVTSLEPSETSKVVINWSDSTITAPYGIRRDDSIMYQFKRVPGLGWWYDYSKQSADSLYCSMRTGDALTVYAAGDKMEKIVFKIKVLDPTADDNLAIPLRRTKWSGPFCRVSNNVPGMDTIYQIEYATPTDTLTKYLEIAPKAKMKYIFVDGLAKRANLKTGDILEVTSESGKVKQYYIKLLRYLPLHETKLVSITWPDIPLSLKNFKGWKQDTIPGFNSTTYSYQVRIPFYYDGIPALIAKPMDLNAKVATTRAVNMIGSVSDRTVTFTVTAEDDTAKIAYKVEFIKEKNPDNIIPWKGAEPFISEFLWKGRWQQTMIEIVNPGTEPLDLSHYMISSGNFSTVSGGITRLSAKGDYNNRYAKYIPGRNWVNRAQWSLTPAFVSITPDPKVSPIVKSGDVFVMSCGSQPAPKDAYNVASKVDIDFKANPWGDTITTQPFDFWKNNSIYLYKILNDSVVNGTKAAIDPADFQIIDVWGAVNSADWVVGGKGVDQVADFLRKPSITHGNPNINNYTDNKGSFGSNATNSEWLNRSWDYWGAIPGGNSWFDIYAFIGQHVMNENTAFKSTVTSLVYKVSEGYSYNESIRGVVSGITVTSFLKNIIKGDSAQNLKLISVANGSIYDGSGVLMNGDSLVVLSKDSSNTTKYILDVTAQGLSRNDTLTSTSYTISITGNTGKVSGIEVGTDLKDLFAGLTVPAYASVTVIDTFGAYVSMKKLNFDTTYTNVKASEKVLIEVLAEDGVNKIVYSLQTNYSASDAYVLSEVYAVDSLLIKYVPYGTTVKSLFANLTPAPGAKLKLFDKNGLERTFGYISLDDILQVTAADDTTIRLYYLEMLGDVRAHAYVTSASYTVDQLDFTINGNIRASLTVSEFVAQLTPAPGAIIKILDKEGNVKSDTAKLAIGDVVQVTSSDGLSQVLYTFNVLGTSVPNINYIADQLLVYPNPSNGIIHVSGLEKDYRICIYNLVGKLVQEKIAQQQEETISLSVPQGVYFVKILVKNKQDVTRKVIIK